MLWYKAWLDTRWRFVLAFLLLAMFACGTVASFGTVQAIAASLPATGGDALQQELRESIEIARTFRGYAWSQWFAGNFPAVLTLLAALLGSGSPLVRSGSGTLFSLALPVSREGWIATRAGMGLAELFALALVPGVAISALAPLVGEQFAFAEGIVYGLSAFVVGSLFFALAVLLSTVLNDAWRPLLLTCLAASMLAGAGMLLPEGRGLFQAMAGGDYFYGGSLPWAELIVSAAAAAALFYAAAASFARRDF